MDFRPLLPLGAIDRRPHRTLVVAILANRPHPEQGFRTCLGILRLYRGIDVARAEAASATAVEIGAFTCSSVASILGNVIAPNTARKRAEPPSLFDHPNVRGAGYFN